MGPTDARRSLAAACRAGQAGAERTSLAFLGGVIICLFLFAVVILGPVFEPVAAACDRNVLGVMKEPVKDRGGRRHIAQELAPVLQRPV